MATTVRRLAAAGGVSVATASRALKGSDAVIASTKQRVLRAAAELDYTPSRLGRSLATGSTGNIGVILPDVTNPFYTTFLAELESALGERDIGILVADSHENPRARTQSHPANSDTGRCAGLRLEPSAGEDIMVASARLPLVLANRMLAAATAIPQRLPSSERRSRISTLAGRRCPRSTRPRQAPLLRSTTRPRSGCSPHSARPA